MTGRTSLERVQGVAGDGPSSPRSSRPRYHPNPPLARRPTGHPDHGFSVHRRTAVTISSVPALVVAAATFLPGQEADAPSGAGRLLERIEAAVEIRGEGVEVR